MWANKGETDTDKVVVNMQAGLRVSKNDCNKGR